MDIDAGVAALAESMIETMYEAPGSGLAANQVGVQKRMFVYDIGEGARAVINPRIVESDGEWTYEEGCLSIPGLSWDIVRPNAVHLVGLDLDGNELSIEATELEGRVFQHELDHLDGILLVERLDADQRKEALRSCGPARWTCLRGIPTGSRASSPGNADPFAGALPRCSGRALPYGGRVARLAFLGTPEMAVRPLRALVAAGHDIALCITRPDRRRGRGGAVTPSPVKEAALALGLPVSHAMEDVAEAGVELAVVVAYGRIIPADPARAGAHGQPPFLAPAPLAGRGAGRTGDPGRGHRDGRLPDEGRGRAGYRTGLCPSRGADRERHRPRRRCAPNWSRWAARSWWSPSPAGWRACRCREPQEGEPTIAAKLTPEDLHLHWEETAAQLHRVVRLDRAWTTFRGRRLGILRGDTSAEADEPIDWARQSGVRSPPGTLVGTSVVTGRGTLLLQRVQPESRTPMAAEDWVRGVRLSVGERLGSE